MEQCWKTAGILTPNRQQKYRDVLEQRLGTIHLVLDNVDDPGNRSAVFRSSDAFGLVKVYIINKRAPREASRMVSRKAEKWLQIEGFTDVADFLEKYPPREGVDEFWLAQPSIHSLALDQIFKDSTPNPSDFRKNQWIVFGNEHDGLSPEWNHIGKRDFWIPLHGFVESLNISVAAAVTLKCVTDWKRQCLGQKGDLSEQEKVSLLSHWLFQSKSLKNISDSTLAAHPAFL